MGGELGLQRLRPRGCLPSLRGHPAQQPFVLPLRRLQPCPLSTGRRTRRVQLVRGEGRDVSS